MFCNLISKGSILINSFQVQILPHSLCEVSL